MKRSSILLASLFALLLTKYASAEVVYTQPALIPDVNGYYSENDGYYQVADSFTLASTATVTNVAWTGGSYVGGNLDFSISFYSDSGGVPGTLLATQNVSPSVTDLNISSYGFELYNYDADIAGFTATAATEYWISISDYGTTQAYFWNDSADGTGYDDGYFTLNGQAFTLSTAASATPEPSSLLLCGSGVLTLAGALRRRLKK